MLATSRRNSCFAAAFALRFALVAGALAKGVAAQTSPPAADLDAAAARIDAVVADLPFTDLDGHAGRLSDLADRRATVVVLRDLHEPAAGARALRIAALERELAASAVAFLFVAPRTDDSADACRADAAAAKFLGRYVRDGTGLFASHLRATTGADVFVLDAARRLRYRGAFDAGDGTTPLVAAAVAALLAGQPIARPATPGDGPPLACPETPIAVDTTPPVLWHPRVAAIVQSRCLPCHRDHGGGPFALLDATDVEGRKAMVRRVVLDRVMPPWFAADGAIGFKNDLRLSAADRLDLLRWLQCDCPLGDPAAGPPARAFGEGWRIGTPDLVIPIGDPIDIPDSGSLDYLRRIVPIPIEREVWVQAIEILPEHPEVVHHVVCEVTAQKAGGWEFLDAYLPGNSPTQLVDGEAVLLRKGSRLGFNLHYTPNGKACREQTRIGFKFAAKPATTRVFGKMFGLKTSFKIPPRAEDFTVVSEYKFEDTCELRRLSPHMHLRGKSSRTELLFPDGHSVVALDLARWDPNWQMSYDLATPIAIVPGTVLRCTSVFDNSAKNPFNPAPDKTVHSGPQVWQEMAGLQFQVALPWGPGKPEPALNRREPRPQGERGGRGGGRAGNGTDDDDGD